MRGEIVEEQVGDRDFAHDIGLGIVIGVPLMYAFATAAAVFGDWTFWKAAVIALMPALVIGPYWGTMLMIGRTRVEHGHEHEGELVLHRHDQPKAA